MLADKFAFLTFEKAQKDMSSAANRIGNWVNND
jgi:hypothetical protein